MPQLLSRHAARARRLLPIFGLVLAAGVALLSIVASEAQAQRAPPQPAPTTLAAPESRIGDNVFVVPDRHARAVTGWLMIRAGCADEAGGCVGIAHYLEHLLFINRDNDHRSKVSLFPDGSGNGWTSQRATAYIQRFPARAATLNADIDKLIAYFAGLLTDVRADQAQAERERNVVLQEYNQQTGRNPFARFSAERNLALMPNEPLGQSIGGDPTTIRAFTLEAARAFHTTWYAKNNAVLVLHGPIDAKDVGPIVERHFAPLAQRPVPANAWKEARAYPPLGETRRQTARDARQTIVSLDRIVTFDEPAAERPLNDAANAILGGYLASRLAESPNEVLVERDGLATDVRLGFSRVRDGAFRLSFSGVPAAGVAPDKVLAAGRAYLEAFAKRGLTPEIVQRLKMRVTNERRLLAEQPNAYASALLGWLGSHGTYEDWQRRQERHESLTADHINRVLRRLTAPGREISGILEPDPSVARPAGASAPAPLPATTSDPAGPQ